MTENFAIGYSDSGAPVNTILVDSNLTITSFGLDEKNELYISASDGKICKFKTPPAIPEFSSWTIYAALIAGTLLVAIIIRKRRFTFSRLHRA